MALFNPNRLFKNLNIRKKLQIAFFLSAILPLAIGGIYSVYYSSRTLRETYLHELTQEVDERGAELEKTIATVRGDVLFLSRLPTFKAYVRSMGRHGVPEPLEVRQPVLEAFSSFARYRPEIYQIRFLDEAGWERLRVDSRKGDVTLRPIEQLQDKSQRYYFRETMQSPQGAVFTSRMDLNEEFGKIEVPHQLVIRFATPFVDEKGRKRGVVILNLYASDLLDLILKLENRPGVKTFFVNSDASFIARGEDGEISVSSLSSGQNPLGPDSKERLFSGKSGLFEDDQYFIIHTPVFYQKENGEFWVLALRYQKGVVLSPLKDFIIVLVSIGLVIALMELFLGALAARQMTVPILAIHRETEKIGRGEYDVHLKVETNDELEQLADAMNSMAVKIQELVERQKGWNLELREEVDRARKELRETLDRAYQMEKMASLGELSAGIAHEIGNPLAAIKTVIQAMEEETTPEEQKVYFQRIISEVDRLNQFLKNFHSFVVPGEKKFVPCDLRKIAEDVVLLVGKEAAHHGVTIQEEFSETPHVVGDPEQIQQILLNLFVNAFHAMPDGGTILLRIHPADSLCSKVSLSITDDGVGIPQENRTKIFDPFFTTRPGGSGLGLAIVYKIIKEHEAEIKVRSETGRGTTFEIVFPLGDHGTK